MCGIYGQWDRGRVPLDLAAIQRATTALRHRGPDDEGYLLGETRAGRYLSCGGRDTSPAIHAPRIEQFRGDMFDLALGFRRLSILDLSPQGHQPMASPDGRWWIVYNGEIYNYRELRAELASLGHRFCGASDTEVLLASFAQWGPACLPRLNGMWAFAIWDGHDEALVLARDRFGVKPLHFAWSRDRLSFASEVKALVGPHGIRFAANEQAVYHYLRSGQLPEVQAGLTFFSGVQALPPGHLATVTRAGFALERYYALPARRSAGTDPGPVVAGYRELLTDAVRLRLRSDVAVGSCLSGGVDSSSIVCLVNRLMGEAGVATDQIGDRQKTFSAVYRTAGPYNEMPHIERVLQATGAEGNFTVPTVERLRAELSKLVWHQDEPFGSSSIFAQWCVMAKARERGVTVLLDGQGADEALGGYRPFDFLLADLVRKGSYREALRTAGQIRRSSGEPPTRLLARALARQLPERYFQRLRGSRLRRREPALRRDFLAGLPSGAEYRPVSRGLARHLEESVGETSLPHLLRFEDRNSMAFSVEARVPFLDYRLVEYSFTQALPWCIRNGWTKWVLRAAMQEVVPEEIIWRRDKVAFETPEDAWLRVMLADPNELLGPDARCGVYLDLDAARAEVRSWLGKGGPTNRIWRWVNLEVWLRAFSGASTGHLSTSP